jgi:hypothetical protein
MMGHLINITVDEEDAPGMDDVEISVDPEPPEPPLSVPVYPEYIPGRDGAMFEPHVVKNGQITKLSFTNNGNRPNPPPVEILDGKDGAGQTVLIGTEAEPVAISEIVFPGVYVLKGNVLDLPDGLEPRPGDSVILSVHTANNLVACVLTYGSYSAFSERSLEQ